MKLKEIVEKLGLEVKTAADKLDNEVTGGYASDLLSDVIANSKEGDLWITLQIHQNIVAVASMKGLSGIVIINSRKLEEETLQKAEEENIPIVLSPMTAFDLAGQLYVMGVIGKNDRNE